MKPINFALAAIAACLILFEMALFFELWEKPEWAGKVLMWGWTAFAVSSVIMLAVSFVKRNQEESRKRRESISNSRQSRKIVKELEESDK